MSKELSQPQSIDHPTTSAQAPNNLTPEVRSRANTLPASSFVKKKKEEIVAEAILEKRETEWQKFLTNFCNIKETPVETSWNNDFGLVGEGIAIKPRRKTLSEMIDFSDDTEANP